MSVVISNPDNRLLLGINWTTIIHKLITSEIKFANSYVFRYAESSYGLQIIGLARSLKIFSQLIHTFVEWMSQKKCCF